MDRSWYRGGFCEKFLVVPEELKPMERTHMEEVNAGEECEFSPGEEGAVGTACDELATDPIPHLPEPLGRRRQRIWE